MAGKKKMEQLRQRIEAGARALREGKFVIITDDEDRENEADLVISAERVTAESVSFLARYTGGVIVVPLSSERLEALRLPLMVPENTEAFGAAFTISVDYRHGTSTGISAEDRAKTIRALADPTVPPEDFRRPGHVFPLRYRDGGVLKRSGHTESSIDLATIAGLPPATAISEMTCDDGRVMRGEELLAFAEEHQIPIVTVADIIRYRRHQEKLVRQVAEAQMPTRFGEFTAYVYESMLDGIEHMALVKGPLNPEEPTLVRVHSECLTGDIFHSKRCDCGTQLDLAMQKIEAEGSGVLLYLRGHEGRGIGLKHKLRAYRLQEQGRDTVEANEELGLPVDSREYGIGAQILHDLKVRKMRLMTNNPAKYGGLDGWGLTIVERVPLATVPTEDNLNYLRTKQEKLGHLLEI